MASRIHVALREARAIERVREATERIAAATEIQAISLPPRIRRNVTTRMAETLEAVADWAEAVGRALIPAGSSDEEAYLREKFEAMSIAEMRAYANAHGIDVGNAKRKPEYVDALVRAGQQEGAAVSDYDAMSDEELRAEAEEREIEGHADMSREELIDALEAADGMTEEDQAEEDGVEADISQGVDTDED